MPAMTNPIHFYHSWFYHYPQSLLTLLFSMQSYELICAEKIQGSSLLDYLTTHTEVLAILLPGE